MTYAKIMVLLQSGHTSQRSRLDTNHGTFKAQTERFFLHCQQAHLCQFKSRPFRGPPQYPTWKHLGTVGINMSQLIGKEVLCTHLFQLVDTGIPTPQNSLIESIQVHPFDGYSRANVPNHGEKRTCLTAQPLMFPSIGIFLIF